MDQAQVEGQGAAGLVAHLHADFLAVGAQADFFVDKPEEAAQLVLFKDLAQQFHQVGGGVDAVLRAGGVGGLAVAQHGAAFLGGGYFKHPLGLGRLGLELLHLLGGADQGALRLKGHRVGDRAGLKALHHRRVVLGVDLKAHVALLAVADTVGGVGGKAHVGLLFPLKVVGHVVHANLLGRAKNDPQLPVALHPGVLQSPQAVEGHNGRPLVVGNAPAKGQVVVDDHGVGVGVPAFPGGDHVQVGHHHGVALALAVLRVGGVVAYVLGLQAIAFRHRHHRVQGPGALVPKGMLALLGLGHRGDGHHRGQIFQNIVPIIQNLLTKQHRWVFLSCVGIPPKQEGTLLR